MKKGLKIVISIISILLILVLIFLGVYYFWPWNRSFFDTAYEEFSIPGLNDGFVPQGFCWVEDGNQYLISGYMKDGSPSRVYLIDAQTGEVIKWVTFKISDARPYDGHAGGIVQYGDNVYIVSKYTLTPAMGEKGYAFRFSLGELRSTSLQSGGQVTFKDSFDTHNNADFVFVYQKYLYVGEYYKAKKYDTDSQHHVTTPAGDSNHAMAYGFALNNTGYQYGLQNSDAKPERVLSLPDCVQGISVMPNGKIVVSSSYGVGDSYIYYYKDILNSKSTQDLRVGNLDYPAWYLDSNALISKMKVPAMSEGIYANEDNVYILFESGSKKYRMFNRNRLTSVYSLPLRYLEK